MNEKCRREHFSRPNSAASERKVSLRMVLETKFSNEKAKSVAESTSRDQIQQRESEKCRKEHFSRPNSATSERKVSQRTVLETKFSNEKAKSVAESSSRDQIQQRVNEKCRRERFSRPNSAANERKVSQRALLKAKFSNEKAKSVAESSSRDQIQQRVNEKCRRELSSRPNSSTSQKICQQKA
jgi:hypothetical protein